MKIFKRLYKPFIIAVAFMLACGTIAYAAWENSFPTTCTDNTSTTRTYYPVLLGYGGQPLVENGKIIASGLDTNMQIGTTNIKYMMSTDEVTCVIPNLPSNGAVTASLYTGYTPNQTEFSIIVGDSGNGTVSDAALIEHGANFTWTFNDIYLKTTTGASKYILRKDEAIKVFESPVVRLYPLYTPMQTFKSPVVITAPP